MSSGSHRGPAQEWPMQAIADDKQFKTPWRFIHTGMMMPGAFAMPGGPFPMPGAFPGWGGFPMPGGV